MCALRHSARWPQLVAISLIGFWVVGCSADSGRFGEGFSSSSSAPPPRSDVTGSIPQTAPASNIESRPLPHLASTDDGTSGGGRGMGSYQPSQPASSDVTGSLPPAVPPPPPSWSWEGGTPITLHAGDTLETLSRRYGVPVAVIMQSNNISNPALVHAGQHLVIPHLKGPAAALAAPQPRLAANAPALPAAAPTLPPAAPVPPPRMALAPSSAVHVVAAGETLRSIAHMYGKPVLVLAKANNIAPDSRVKIGERIIVPDAKAAAQAPAALPKRVEAPPPAAAPQNLASVAESPHSARLASPAAPAEEDSAVKTAEPAGKLGEFRWPVRGRVIAGFGPKPNGLQNDGINLAVPEGTPVKAAEDGVVAYAGNELKGYGNLVLLRHSNGFVTAYAHASEILVKKGDVIKRGQTIAKSGQTGSVTAPQLHFEIRKGSTPVDPAQYLNGA
jgi:murein DD-endopeptidase MepM/ murein hydrolase activator NlpD